MSHVDAMPVASSDTSYYSITGNTAADLRAQMHSQGPLDAGRHFDAKTHYDVKWHYQYQQEDDGCRLTSVNVTLATQMILPRWQNYDAASPAMQHNWDEYFSKLILHENGHAANGQHAASEIDNMLANLPAMTSCELLEQTANGRAYDILAKYKQADVDYDRETKHGITQGVVLKGDT